MVLGSGEVGVVLRLEVLDFAGPTRWRWRLTQETNGGRFVADHDVVLDESDWQYEAFTDLDGYLRENPAPDQRLASEAELTAMVGAWIGEQVLGPVGVALALARQTVRLEVPADAEVLAYRPWELARVGDRALAMQQVSFVIDLPRSPRDKAPIGDRLRMLAVFSLPEDASSLNLRRERHALAQCVYEIAKTRSKAVELRVLQYGATRARLEDALLEAPGWDVLHFSGHGLPAGLVLEHGTGQRDLVSSGELVELLELAADQIKLVTLSTCESAAVTAVEHLRLLGLRPTTLTGDTDGSPTQSDGQEPSVSPAAGRAGEDSLPAVATELVRRLDCAVLAMRYPVVDEFAIELAKEFYDLVLGKGQPVARALGLTLPRVIPGAPTLGVPALSVATPALFGARAVGLTLSPPPGEPVVFQAKQQKLAGFKEQKQPEKFVGRVGPMTRATTALAPRSGRTGVLFHGMAGAGKTACALELAYTHEASFARLVWHRAPVEGHDITTALTDLATDFEAQIPGLRMVHLVDDIQKLRDFLPVLTEFLRKERILLVLDNLESLLTPEGQWRDQRWELLIDALTEHDGLSRVVLTSRRRPARLHPGIVVEPVHALSLTETVLLAREWPRLRAMLDATTLGLTGEQAHELAVRTLAVVQGHPKLIELAEGQAADPTVLQVRLAEADRIWLTTGVRLKHFLDRGETTATDQEYVQILDDWTRGSITTIPEESATLFAFLCCLEQQDRIGGVIKSTWPNLWRRLSKPSPAPDPVEALAVLVQRALITEDNDPDTGQRIHIHPGVAEPGRTTAGPDVPTAVDTELADFWLTVLSQEIEQGSQERGRLILRAARAAAPYLIRQHQWRPFLAVVDQVLYRDQSPATITALLPLLHMAIDATRGTDLELVAWRTYAAVLAMIRPDEAERRLRQLLDTAVAQERYDLASAITSELITLCRDTGRLDKALALVEVKKDYTRRTGYGPWTQLGDEGRRLQILGRQGHNEQVLTTVQELRNSMATLPESTHQPEGVHSWNVRETILDVGRVAARDLHRWQEALDLNSEILESMRRRGATDLGQTQVAFNNYWALMRLGRTDEAKELLWRCRTVFEAEHNVEMLGKVLSALAHVEDAQGHGDRAIQQEKEALRLKYIRRDPEAIEVSHLNLADYLRQNGGDEHQVWAHRLAAAVIAYQTDAGTLTERISALAQLLAQGGEAALPASFDEVCRIVAQVQGVNLGELVRGLPQRAADGQAAMTEVLRLAGTLLQRYLAMWDPVISLMVAADRGDPGAVEALGQVLTSWGEHVGWQQLVVVLRRICAGERDPALTGLDRLHIAVVQRALDALAGNERDET